MKSSAESGVFSSRKRNGTFEFNFRDKTPPFVGILPVSKKQGRRIFFDRRTVFLYKGPYFFYVRLQILPECKLPEISVFQNNFRLRIQGKKDFKPPQFSAEIPLRPPFLIQNFPVGNKILKPVIFQSKAQFKLLFQNQQLKPGLFLQIPLYL